MGAQAEGGDDDVDGVEEEGGEPGRKLTLKERFQRLKHQDSDNDDTDDDEEGRGVKLSLRERFQRRKNQGDDDHQDDDDGDESSRKLSFRERFQRRKNINDDTDDNGESTSMKMSFRERMKQRRSNHQADDDANASPSNPVMRRLHRFQSERSRVQQEREGIMEDHTHDGSRRWRPGSRRLPSHREGDETDDLFASAADPIEIQSSGSNEMITHLNE